MKPSAKSILKVYDRFCKISCGLELGASQKFENDVMEQQAIKVSKEKIVSNVFDDATKQRKFRPILNDVIIKTLNDPTDKEIFRAGLEGMERNYPEILSGEQKHLFMCPPAFNYDSRIKPSETSVPKALEERMAALRANPIRTEQEQKDLECIEDHLQRILPQISEAEVVAAFEKFFYPCKGIFIHSLKLDDHLKVFIDKARHEKNQLKDTGFKLTALEERIAQALNISQAELQLAAEKVVDTLRDSENVSSGSLVGGYKIHEIIDEVLSDDAKQKAKSKFKTNRKYTLSQVARGIRLAKFEDLCQFSGENDLFIMLPDRKLIICVEVKRHMNENPGAGGLNIDRNLKDAAKQLRKNANYTSQVHGAILSPGWKFVKVAVIAPDVYNKEKICQTCNPFVISTDMINQPGGMEKWWKNSGLDSIKELDEKSKKEAYNEFLMFFNRLVNLSKVRLLAKPTEAWKQIQGEHYPRQITAGHIAAEPPPTSMKELLNRPHDAYKVIFLNKDQECLLSNDNRFVAFFNDFGSGKSLISKEKAIQTANEDEADPVFFVSLVGVNSCGTVEDEEYIFDIYSKEYDFCDSDVEVKSAQDLWECYEAQHKGSDKSKIDIYALVEDFIQQHPHAHYILDECPFLRSPGYFYYDDTSVKRAKDFVSRCKSIVESDSNLFWVAFQSNVLADVDEVKDSFQTKFPEMKEELKKKGFMLPILECNMRNQSNIANLIVEKGRSIGKMQSSIGKLSSASTVVGEQPFLIKIEEDDWNQKKEEVLKYSIDWMLKKNEKNIVILCGGSSYLKDIENKVKNVIKNKTIVSYPSLSQNKQQSILNVKDFCEKNNHILVTEKKYFDGCEASNVIYLNLDYSCYGARNCLMRGVQNVLVVDFLGGAEIKGMKVEHF